MAPIALPVSIQTRVIRRRGTLIYYPQVFGLHSSHVQQTINEEILHLMKTLINTQHEQQGTAVFVEMLGTYELKTNERNILSLSLSNYAFAEHHAHGLTILKSLTFDIQTGKNYQLEDLFKPGSDYVKVLSEKVQQQIHERDIQLLDGFKGISPNQDFYIADKCLVLYFQLYEITPYYVGFPMFPISVFDIQDIVTDDGPLGRMATNS